MNQSPNQSQLRAGLYARVSTADQQTLPMQINAMTEYALRRGWIVLASVQDVNGGTKHRPKREELIKSAPATGRYHCLATGSLGSVALGSHP